MAQNLKATFSNMVGIKVEYGNQNTDGLLAA